MNMTDDDLSVLLVSRHRSRLEVMQLAILAAGPFGAAVSINREDERERLLNSIYDGPEPYDALYPMQHRHRPRRVIQLPHVAGLTHVERPQPLTKRQRRRQKGKRA